MRSKLGLVAFFALALTLAIVLPSFARAEHGGSDADGSCGPDGTVVVIRGETYSLSMTFVNHGDGSGPDAHFTATMLANTIYGAEHTMLTRTVADSVGASVNLDFLSTDGLPATTDRVIIEIKSDLTGDTVLGTCDFYLVIGSEDTDGDGLADNWEAGGLDLNGGGADVQLPGATVGRKDLYVEIDCLVAADHSHCPRQDSMQDVVQSFANAPVPNGDGTTGVQLHLDTGMLYGAGVTSVAGTGGVTGTFGNLGGGGSQIAEAGNEIVDWDGAAGDPATSFYDLKTANFNSNRAYVYRYAIIAHQTNGRRPAFDCTSGWAEDIPGNDFLVTLGGQSDSDKDGVGDGPCWTTDASGFSVGSRKQQAGTFMHEFGHTLGLGHGGGDGANNKPNYLSVMNYSFQMCSVTTKLPSLPGACDFSRDDLDDLTETLPPGLDECKGLNDPYGLGQVDWDNDTIFEGSTCTPASANVSVDINGDDVCVKPGDDGTLDAANSGDDVVSGSSILDGPDFTCNSTAADDDVQVKDVGTAQTEPLTGYDDWDGLVYNFRGTSAFANGVANPVENEADPQTIQEAQQQLLETLEPHLLITKTGPTTANAGDALTYTIVVTNSGPGPAISVGLTDTLPDGSTVPFNLGTLTAGSSATRTVSLTTSLLLLPTTLVNTATASGTNMLGLPATATGSATTALIAAPPTRNPQSIGFWRTHPELWTVAVRASIQATDGRFDGADGSAPNGVLTSAEIAAILTPGGNMNKVLQQELLATYFNLATHRINAGTRISSRTANRLGLATVRAGALYAIETLALPVTNANRARYSDATTVLDEINNGKSEIY